MFILAVSANGMNILGILSFQMPFKYPLYAHCNSIIKCIKFISIFHFYFIFGLNCIAVLQSLSEIEHNNSIKYKGLKIILMIYLKTIFDISNNTP